MNKFFMQQAQKIQERLVKAQEELADIVVEASAGGGAVKVAVNAQQKIQSVAIAPDVVNPDDVEMLQDLVLVAVSEGIARSQEAAAKHLGAITGGLNIPGLT